MTPAWRIAFETAGILLLIIWTVMIGVAGPIAFGLWVFGK